MKEEYICTCTKGEKEVIACGKERGVGEGEGSKERRSDSFYRAT